MTVLVKDFSKGALIGGIIFLPAYGLLHILTTRVAKLSKRKFIKRIGIPKFHINDEAGFEAEYEDDDMYGCLCEKNAGKEAFFILI